MHTRDSTDKLFVDDLTEYVLSNLGKEHLSIDELSTHLGLSRSSIYRKLKLMKKESLSQFVRELRLKRALEMLLEKLGTASEIGYKVGFSSPAYFTKCFHDYYGFSPGEVIHGRNQTLVQTDNTFQGYESNADVPSKNRPFLSGILRLKKQILFMLVGLIWFSIVGLISYIFYLADRTENSMLSNSIHPKTLLFLPFKSFTDNISCQYFADGIVDDLRDCLSKSTCFKILSKNSSAQIAGSNLSTRQIFRRMDADYMMEGSIQSDSINIRFAVQLIDIKLDRQIWAEPFEFEKNKNILIEQANISKHIALDLEQIICDPKTNN